MTRLVKAIFFKLFFCSTGSIMIFKLHYVLFDIAKDTVYTIQ